MRKIIIQMMREVPSCLDRGGRFGMHPVTRCFWQHRVLLDVRILGDVRVLLDVENFSKTSCFG